MSDLTDPLSSKLRKLVSENNSKYEDLSYLVNEVITEDTDLEHLITFLADSPSLVHRQFAEDLRKCFYTVLANKLREVESELKDQRFDLYAMLLDMYNMEDCPETLNGILTINYDDYIEAAESYLTSSDDTSVDYGIDIGPRSGTQRGLRIVKLHGSFSWQDKWPIRLGELPNGETPLWIPPGIHKAKERYPFNLLWGRAREILQCDVLRIIGCRLSPNDWDLIALLFTSRHAVVNGARPFTIEIIDSPARANELKMLYPIWMSNLS